MKNLKKIGFFLFTASVTVPQNIYCQDTTEIDEYFQDTTETETETEKQSQTVITIKKKVLPGSLMCLLIIGILILIATKSSSSDEEESGNYTTDIAGLKKFTGGNKGELFTGGVFTASVTKIIKDAGELLTDEVVRPLIIKELITNKWNLAKENASNCACNSTKGWIWGIEHDFIDGSFKSAQTVVLFDNLLSIFKEVDPETYVQFLHEKDGGGCTILNNLINRCGPQKDPKESFGTDVNCLAHINVLLKRGMDPKEKSSVSIGNTVTGKVKNSAGNWIRGDSNPYKIQMTAIEQAAGNYQSLSNRKPPKIDESKGDEYEPGDRSENTRITIARSASGAWEAKFANPPNPEGVEIW